MLRTHTEVRFDDLIYARNALKASEDRCNYLNSLDFYKKSIEKIVNHEVEGITLEVLAYTKEILEEINRRPYRGRSF